MLAGSTFVGSTPNVRRIFSWFENEMMTNKVLFQTFGRTNPEFVYVISVLREGQPSQRDSVCVPLHQRLCHKRGQKNQNHVKQDKVTWK